MAGGYCPVPDPEWGLVRRLVGTVDCNIDGLAARGYAEFAGGPATGVLTGLLTLYVAFIGYRLLLGRGPITVGDFVLSAIKIGAVLLLATHWSAYQVLVYDTLSNGPQQLAAHLLASVRPDGSALGGDPLAGLQAAYDTLAEGANFVGGRAGAASPFTGGVAFTAAALNGAAVLLLMSTLGVLLAAKIVLALLLALAPVLIGLALFDATRRVVQGWLAAAIGFALIPLGVVLTLSVELVALTPLLIRLSASRAAGEVDATTALSVALLVLVFAGVLSGLILAGAVMAAGVRLPGARGATPFAAASHVVAGAMGADRVSAAPAPSPELARAARVGAAFAAMERREAQARPDPSANAVGERRVTLPPARDGSGPVGPTTPLGASWRRPPLRTSASSRIRDNGQAFRPVSKA